MQHQDPLFLREIRKIAGDEELFGRVLGIVTRKSTGQRLYTVENNDWSRERLTRHQVKTCEVELPVLQLTARHMSGRLVVEAVGMNGELMAATILTCGDTVGTLRRALLSAVYSAAKYLADAEEVFHDDALLTQTPITGTDSASTA